MEPSKPAGARTTFTHCDEVERMQEKLALTAVEREVK